MSGKAVDGGGLVAFMHWLALDGLSEPAGGWMHAIRRADYAGVQFIEPLDPGLVEQARAASLRVCGSGRVNSPADAFRLAREARDHGLECLTLHVGWGMEEDSAAVALIEAVLDASQHGGMPLFVETHRATIFQDIWRSVDFVRRYPDLRFNADFSHWYTGLELVYGDFDEKLAFITPIIERCRFMHGRIGDPGCIQVALTSIEAALGCPYVLHFREMWSAVFRTFAQRYGKSAEFPFAPEILSSKIYYAQTRGGCEESDRWEESLVITNLARSWYAAVTASI